MENLKVGDVIVSKFGGAKFRVDEIGDNYAGMEGETWVGAREIDPRLVPMSRQYKFLPLSYFLEFYERG